MLVYSFTLCAISIWFLASSILRTERTSGSSIVSMRLFPKSGKAMLFKRLDFPDAVCFGTILSLGGMPFTGYVFKGVCKFGFTHGLFAVFLYSPGSIPSASSRLASSRFSRAIFRVMAGYSPKLSSLRFSVKTIVHAPQPAASFWAHRDKGRLHRYIYFLGFSSGFRFLMAVSFNIWQSLLSMFGTSANFQ